MSMNLLFSLADLPLNRSCQGLYIEVLDYALSFRSPISNMARRLYV